MEVRYLRVRESTEGCPGPLLSTTSCPSLVTGTTGVSTVHGWGTGRVKRSLGDGPERTFMVKGRRHEVPPGPWEIRDYPSPGP